MLGAAVLGAEKVVLSRLRGLEPHTRVATRDDVFLDPKRRDRERVDHILRRHGQIHRLIDGDVELVDLAFSLWMLNFPHPLLAHRVHVDGVTRYAVQPEVYLGAERKDAQGYNQRDDAPDDLQRYRAVHGFWPLILRAAAVLHREKDDGEKDGAQKQQG